MHWTVDGINDAVSIPLSLAGNPGCKSFSFKAFPFRRGMSKRQYRRKQLKQQQVK